MKINPHIFRGYDIRGVVDEDLNLEIVETIGKAHGTFLKRAGITKAVVGRDCRKTSPEYSQAVIKGLNWAGIDTVDIGMELVGTFYWSQYFLDCKGGVYVSASHNPAQYNGFKLAVDFSETMVSESIQELREMIENDDFEKGETFGKNEQKSIRRDYFSKLLEKFSFSKKFKVLVDTNCSTAGEIVPEILRKIGSEVIEKNCIIDPSFPLGTADPTDYDFIKRLSEEVLQEKANIGFCYDTAHGFESGVLVDFSKPSLDKFTGELEKLIGLEKWWAIHANDSKTLQKSNKDRHENIGEGYIGQEAFSNMLRHPEFKTRPFILEVPGFDDNGPDKKNIDILRNLI